MSEVTATCTSTEATSLSTMNACFSCGKLCSLRCSGCRLLGFCNQECQKSSWKSHKAFCRAVSSQRKHNGDRLNACLIVDGMGPLGPDEDYMIGAKEHLMAINVPVLVVDATKGGRIPEQVAALLRASFVQSMIMLGWGGGDHPVETEFSRSTIFREASVDWVQKGGSFVVQGERVVMRGWPRWFDKAWTDGDYRRTDYRCFAQSENSETSHWCQWYRSAPGAVLDGYNVKACMLKDVDASDILFGTTAESRSYSLVPVMSGEQLDSGMAPVVLSKYGYGTVSFFGDVNFEDETLRIMAIVAKGQ